MPDNIVPGQNFKTAIVNSPLSSLPLTGINNIYGASSGGTYISYKPGRSINSLSAIEIGKAYLISSTQLKDLTAFFGTPTGGEATKWDAVEW